MNPEIKTLWLEALRSGDYNKGTGQLYYRDPDSNQECHCALGVLAEEAAKVWVIQVVHTSGGNGRFGPVSDNRLLPDAVAEWAGLGDFENEEGPIARHNDDAWLGDKRDLTFESTAAFIQENF